MKSILLQKWGTKMEIGKEEDIPNEPPHLGETLDLEALSYHRSIEILGSLRNGAILGSADDISMRNQAIVTLGKFPSIGTDGLALVMKEILFSDDHNTPIYGLKTLHHHSPQLSIAIAYFLRGGRESSLFSSFLEEHAPEVALAAKISDSFSESSKCQAIPFMSLASSHPEIALSIGHDLIEQGIPDNLRNLIEKTMKKIAAHSPLDREQVRALSKVSDFISLLESSLDRNSPDHQQLAALKKFVDTYKVTNFKETFALLFCVIKTNTKTSVEEYALKRIAAILD